MALVGLPIVDRACRRPVARRRPERPAAVGGGSGHGAVAAAQRKPASSRATATVATLCGLPRSRRRWWRRCRRCWARQAICRTWSGWPAWRLRERDADPGLAGVVPGGLDQQPAGVGRAGLGDRALASWTRRTGRATGVSPSHADELARRAEALPVAAELEMQRQRSQRVDAAEARAAARRSATAARPGRAARAARRAPPCARSARRRRPAGRRTRARSARCSKLLARRASAGASRFQVVALGIDAAVRSAAASTRGGGRASDRRGPARARARDAGPPPRNSGGTAHRRQLPGQQPAARAARRPCGRS